MHSMCVCPPAEGDEKLETEACLEAKQAARARQRQSGDGDAFTGGGPHVGQHMGSGWGFVVTRKLAQPHQPRGLSRIFCVECALLKD